MNDGGVQLSAGWLGNAWDLYLGQLAGRAVALLVTFGPAWAARWAFDLGPATYVTVAHMLYFAVPLLLWLAIRAIEPHRVFSRLYLAAVLALVYFPTEVIVGLGLWMIWAAVLVDPARSTRQSVVITLVLAPLIAFTHPSLAAMSVLYAAIGGVLLAFGRPFPRRAVVVAAAMSVLLLAAYAATSIFLPPTNPTILRALAANRYNHIDPLWMVATFVMFPMLAALWLLLLAPGTESARLRWRLSPRVVMAVAVFGLWFAVNGTSLLTWLSIRHTASYVLVLALALALAAPANWLMAARRPLTLFAAIAVGAALSYAVDLTLLGRFIDQRGGFGIIDVDASTSTPWPPPRPATLGSRVYFKWVAGNDYVRDVVVPDYDWYRVTLAFHSFFRSDGRTVLFHRLAADKWIPFECAAIERARSSADGKERRMFLRFLDENYCVR